MEHIMHHISTENSTEGHKEMCRYCMKSFASAAVLSEHLSSIHPLQTRDGRGSFKCIICRVSTKFIQHEYSMARFQLTICLKFFRLLSHQFHC